MKQKVAEILNVIFGFRKFIALLAILAVGIVFRIKGMVSGSEFVDLIKNTTISFFAANGVEHIMTTIKDYANMKTAQLADTDESNDEEEVEMKV